MAGGVGAGEGASLDTAGAANGGLAIEGRGAGGE